MTKPKREKFSLYSWLLKKLRKELIVWYFFTFLSSFFYYQAVFGLKNWCYQEPPYSLFFETINITSRDSLILYVFFCFFVGSLLTNLICDYLRNYTLELCRTHLRKWLLNYSAENPQKNRKKILSNFLGETELFVPLFVLSPHRIYAAIINITLNFIFLTNFRGNNFAIIFVISVSLIIAFLSFFSYQTQTKINQKQNKFRYQENQVMEKYLEKQAGPQKVESLINSNFQKTRYSLRKKTLSQLPTLIIPGLNILFCLIYSKNWKIENFVEIFMVANAIQTIFWKVKDITDNLPEISKIKTYYKLIKPLEVTKKNISSSTNKNLEEIKLN